MHPKGQSQGLYVGSPLRRWLYPSHLPTITHLVNNGYPTMSSDMKERIREALDGRIDFEGQKLVDKLIFWWLILATFVSFLLGYLQDSLQFTGIIFGTMVAFLAFAVLPPWPFLNSHPVTWLPAKSQSETKKDQ